MDSYTIATYPELKPKWYDALIEAGAEIKAAMVRDELGEFNDLYETLNRVKGMSTLQCHMDYVEVSL